MKKLIVAAIAGLFFQALAEAKPAAAARTSNNQIPSYTYDCDDESFCEGIPTDAAQAETSRVIPPAVASGSKLLMLTRADIQGDGVTVPRSGLARSANVPSALVQSQAIQGQLLLVERFLDGSRGALGYTSPADRLKAASVQ